MRTSGRTWRNMKCYNRASQSHMDNNVNRMLSEQSVKACLDMIWETGGIWKLRNIISHDDKAQRQGDSIKIQRSTWAWLLRHKLPVSCLVSCRVNSHHSVIFANHFFRSVSFELSINKFGKLTLKSSLQDFFVFLGKEMFSILYFSM